MSLCDVGRDGSDRTETEVNAPDMILDGARMAHQTVSSHYQPTGDGSTAKLRQVGKTIIANDGTTNKASFGYNPALNSWGTFVADDGTDVMTNTDLDKLVFNSNQNVFKIVKTFTIHNTKAANSNVNITTTPHGMIGIPAIMAFTADSTDTYRYMVPYNHINTSNGTTDHTIQCSVDGTNIYTFQGGMTGTTYYTSQLDVDILVYVLQESAS